MSIAALSFRLSAETVIGRAGTRSVVLLPVHSDNPSDPNRSFSKFSPNAKFEFTVTNPDAFDFLEPGKVYDLVIVPHDSGYAISVDPASADLPPPPPPPPPLTADAPSAPVEGPPVDPAPVVATAAVAPAPVPAPAASGEPAPTEPPVTPAPVPSEPAVQA